jgi:predicted Rossmann fold nucleotide-binding protein DprA/Smf involved in DNA uptake
MVEWGGCMKLAIVGSRYFNDFDRLIATVSFLFTVDEHIEIVSGGAKGTDTLAKRLAVKYGHKYKEFLPRVGQTYAQKCFNRNKEIVQYSDAILAFWDGRIQSCGTLLTMQLAVQSGKRLYAIGVKV